MAAKAEMSQSDWSRMERGVSNAADHVPTLRRVARALEVPVHTLIPDEESTVKRRQLLDLTVKAAVGLTAAGTLPTVQAKLGPVVTRDDVELLQTRVDELYARDNLAGGGVVLREAERLYRLAENLLNAGHYPDSLTDSLLSATGTVAGAAAWFAFDSGDRPRADFYAARALTLTEEMCAPDEALLIRVVDLLAFQSMAPGSARVAVRRSARLASLTRRHPSHRLQALVASREAVAAATAGRKDLYDNAIRQAWRELDRSDSADVAREPAWMAFIGEAEIRNLQARGLGFLGEHSSAVELFRETIGTAGVFPRDEASHRAYLTASLIDIGDTRSAVQEGELVLDILAGRTASPRLLTALMPLRRAVAAGRDDAACQFRSRFDKLTAREPNAAAASPTSLK